MILLIGLSKLNWSNASIVLIHLGMSQFDKLLPVGYHLHIFNLVTMSLQIQGFSIVLFFFVYLCMFLIYV